MRLERGFHKGAVVGKVGGKVTTLFLHCEAGEGLSLHTSVSICPNAWSSSLGRVSFNVNPFYICTHTQFHLIMC